MRARHDSAVRRRPAARGRAGPGGRIPDRRCVRSRAPPTRLLRRYLGAVTTAPPEPPVRPVRWGIVGTSDIADRVMAPAMRDAASAELVAIASSSPNRAADFA